MDVWINPNNTDHVITGDDGGSGYSYDGGKSKLFDYVEAQISAGVLQTVERSEKALSKPAAAAIL